MNLCLAYIGFLLNGKHRLSKYLSWHNKHHELRDVVAINNVFPGVPLLYFNDPFSFFLFVIIASDIFQKCTPLKYKI